jgi:cell division protein FtsW (lipid II flippase)
MEKLKRLRLTEFQLLIIPALLALVGMLTVVLVPRQQVQWEAKDIWTSFVFIGLVVGAHLALTFGLPRADQLILPIISSLTVFGLIMTQRLQTNTGERANIASRQTLWIALGYIVFVATVLGLRNLMLLKRYKYTFMALGLALTAAAAVFGTEINGARLWFRFGFFNFQPGELLKICLVIFLAGYLDDNRLLISQQRGSGFKLPPIPYLGPMVAIWAICMLLLFVQKDLGPAQLFFGVFLVMLYVASGRASYVIVGLVVFLLSSVVAYQLFDHVQVRVTAWLNPWPYGQGQAYQIVQALFSFADGGVFGQGLGYGAPYFIPEVHTDYVFAALGEEIGLAGTIGLIAVNILFFYRGYHIAVNARNGFYQYLAIGLTTLLGLQTFIIMGGVTKLIPLTGMTLPFISYGGSSILINFIIAGLLVRISAAD